VTDEKFCVFVTNGTAYWPRYFGNFYWYCQELAHANGWQHDTTMNYQLRELGGKLIKTKTQGWYLRWDNEQSHTAFVLKWS
jgi:hypothetical protein